MSSVSVIIPTLNEAGFVEFLLDDLRAQTHPIKEIIVVDGNSEDDTISRVKTFDTVRVLSSSRGVATQRNHGAQESSGEWLVFLDADVRLQPDWLEKALHQVKNRGLKVAVPQYWPRNSYWYINAFYAVSNFVFWLGEKRFPSGAGSALLIQKSLFAKLKGFRTYAVGEDMDLIQRAAKKGSFGVLSLPLFVSDRRFRTYGFGSTVWTYLMLSRDFLTADFSRAQSRTYTFGTYQQKADDKKQQTPSAKR